MAMTLCCLQTKCIVGPYTRFLSHVMCQKYERHNGRIQGQSCRDASLSLVYFLGHGGVRSPPPPPVPRGAGRTAEEAIFISLL